MKYESLEESDRKAIDELAAEFPFKKQDIVKFYLLGGNTRDALKMALLDMDFQTISFIMNRYQKYDKNRRV